MSFLDHFTTIDDLLVELLERLGGTTEDATYFFAYPNDGTRATIEKGTTSIDFLGGTVTDASDEVTTLGNSLRAKGRDFCRSLTIQADRDIIVQIGNSSKIPIFAGTWFKVSHLRFTDVKITAIEDSSVFVFASTNPDAIEMAGESYTKDPVDPWGYVSTIGNAELAVRTHAPPMTYDRRGNALRWVDFESPTKNYADYSNNCTYNRSQDTVLNGDFSLKTSLQNASSYHLIKMRTADYHATTAGLQVVSCSTNKYSWETHEISVYDGALQHYFYLLYNREDGKLQIVDDGPNYVLIDTIGFATGLHVWNTLKLVVDLDGMEYVRALAFGKGYDLSGYSAPTSVSAEIPHAVYTTKCEGSNTGTCSYYRDNIIITQGEPL